MLDGFSEQVKLLQTPVSQLKYKILVQPTVTQCNILVLLPVTTFQVLTISLLIVYQIVTTIGLQEINLLIV